MTQQPSAGDGQPTPPAPGTPRPGDLLDRFLARLVDYLLLAVVNGIVVSTIVVGMLMGHRGGLGGYGFGYGAGWAANAVATVLTAALALGYFAFLESSRGQTLGKMLLKLKTTGPDGRPPSLDQAVRRNIWTALGVVGIIPLGGWLASVLSLVAVVLIAVGIANDTVGRQGWHDHFAGETRVWKVG